VVKPVSSGKKWVDSMQNDPVAQEKIKAISRVVSFRTSKIDSDIKDALVNKGFKQVCVLGAGLDTRPWRLETGLSKDQIKYFEVDFPEIFDYKLPILQKNGAVELVDYCKVEADLSLPTWLRQLEQAGFNRQSTGRFFQLEHRFYPIGYNWIEYKKSNLYR
jgi:methyltransferase (TIGR00027 family)